MSVQVLQGDCIQVMRALKDNSVDSVVTDPPYGLAFMGAEWDSMPPPAKAGHRKGAILGNVPSGLGSTPENRVALYKKQGLDLYEFSLKWAAECLRVLKPGGHLLAFGGTRTYHRMACAIEDAGFEIRDSIHWVTGSGFPKSLDISRVIDKRAGAEREVIGYRKPEGSAIAGNAEPDQTGSHIWTGKLRSSVALTDAGKQWNGWGTALKPAHEPIVVARKPLTETVAANVLEWGTGGINVDGCRVGSDDKLVRPDIQRYDNQVLGKGLGSGVQTEPGGRWPPNLLLTHSAECEPAGTAVVRGDNRQGGTGRRPGGFGNVGADAGDAEPNGPLYGNAIMQVWDCAPGCPVIEMDEQSGTKTSGKSKRRHEAYSGESDTGFLRGFSSPDNQYDDTGGASRFFPVFKYQAKAPAKERVKVDGISHPTCKPLGLMRWLVRLVTPPGGICLDLFAGSGTTGEACLDEGFSCILIEREPDYIKLIKERLGRREPTLWDSLWE